MRLMRITFKGLYCELDFLINNLLCSRHGHDLKGAYAAADRNDKTQELTYALVVEYTDYFE